MISVESLLNETNLNVHVYNGNVDLIVDTPGIFKCIILIIFMYEI